ncbi:MAG: rhomboid family intramembrane serine protease [Candidatus Tectimicrobiota bacterium]|nr:MAG: rhomboid family intramembrane serine protease [Candidatus Tectomicrobia bacterium]
MFPVKDTIPSRQPPLMVWLLIAANTLVFLYELGLSEAELEAFFYRFGLVPARYTHPEWAVVFGLPLDDYWPFLTSMFLHGGWLHFLSNMWTLWIFGDNVEDRMGPLRFLLFYLLCGLAAGLVHWLTNPHSTLPTVGASGAISGVMGAYFLLFPHSRIIALVPVFFWPFFVEIPAVFYLGMWFVSQLFSGVLSLAAAGQVGGIAWWAHIGGFAAGIALRPFFVPPRRPFQDDEYDIERAFMRW